MLDEPTAADPGSQESRRRTDEPCDVVGPFHIGLVNFLVALMLAEFVISPLSTLAHELGHARAALRAAPGKVTIVVGRKTAAVGIFFERFGIWWSPIPARGVSFRGICIWNARLATSRGRLAVAMRGPIVTALLIPLYAAAAVATRTSPAWIPATFGLSAFACFVGCLVNLDPRITAEEKKGSLRRDGPQALAAYRAMRRARQGDGPRGPVAPRDGGRRESVVGTPVFPGPPPGASSSGGPAPPGREAPPRSGPADPASTPPPGRT